MTGLPWETWRGRFPPRQQQLWVLLAAVRTQDTLTCGAPGPPHTPAGPDVGRRAAIGDSRPLAAVVTPVEKRVCQMTVSLLLMSWDARQDPGRYLERPQRPG